LVAGKIGQKRQLLRALFDVGSNTKHFNYINCINYTEIIPVPATLSVHQTLAHR
jgi:hypothetical protein